MLIWYFHCDFDSISFILICALALVIYFRENYFKFIISDRISEVEGAWEKERKREKEKKKDEKHEKIQENNEKILEEREEEWERGRERMKPNHSNGNGLKLIWFAIRLYCKWNLSHSFAMFEWTRRKPEKKQDIFSANSNEHYVRILNNLCVERPISTRTESNIGTAKWRRAKAKSNKKQREKKISRKEIK